MIVFSYFLDGHSTLDVTFVGQIRRIRDDKVKVLMVRRLDGERILVVVEEEILSVALEASIVFEKFYIDLVAIGAEIWQVRMRLELAYVGVKTFEQRGTRYARDIVVGRRPRLRFELVYRDCEHFF